MKSVYILLFVLLIAATSFGKGPEQFLVVLGTAQDAGYPQIGSEKEYDAASKNPRLRQKVVSLGMIDLMAKKKFLFEATPDMPEQLFMLNRYLPSKNTLPDGVFLTHAHIGHYTGLMYFGREAIGASNVPVYAMPKMQRFLETNGPWGQLVSLKNIELRNISGLDQAKFMRFTSVKPFLVPHRDEYSETVGFLISGRNKRALFIPDIDKWDKWDRDLKEIISKVDYALLDATFYKNGEIPRDMSEVPHPFVVETMELLKDLSAKEKSKVIFIHFNHTNPLLKKNSPERREVLRKGFRVADEGMILGL